MWKGVGPVSCATNAFFVSGYLSFLNLFLSQHWQAAFVCVCVWDCVCVIVSEFLCVCCV
jgi:hypothetical protein